MAYGVEIYVNGKTFSTLGWTPYNYIDSFELVAGTASGSKSYTLGSGRVLRILADTPAGGEAFTVTVSGNTVSWTKLNDDNNCIVEVVGLGT